VGVLPASPGGADKAAKMASMERERTSQLADVVMQDLALTVELLRQVNAALFKGSRETASGPVLTVRRAIAMLGLNGVRRAALSLRPWPGPLNEADALELQRTMRRAQRAAAVAQALRPAHWDAEVVAVVTLLQSLGNLLLHYHLPDDVRQIKRLMQAQPVPRRPGRAGEDGPPDMQPGLGEVDAALAVLGVEPDAVAAAVARHWGLDDGVALLMRRLPRETSVLLPDSDDAFLRTLASCAHETLDAAAQPASQTAAALARVAHRYAKALQTTPESLKEALSASVAERASVPQI
jgi:eukaryotic-like serine/threonine-protein kinase